MKVLAVYVPFHEFLSEFLLLQGLHFIDCWDWWVRVLSQGSAETSYSYAINGTAMELVDHGKFIRQLC